MFRKAMVLGLSLVMASGLLLGAEPANPDEVIIRYPAGFTKLVIADLAKLTGDPTLAEFVMAPLAAARHPLNGINQIVQDTLQLPPHLVQFVAHGTGPEVTGLSLIQGLPQQAAFGALFGLQFAVGAPGSPFTNWDLGQSNGLPLILTGGVFGPVQIQWGYAFAGDALWVGTETSFGPPPDVARLQSTMDAVTRRAAGEGDFFDELLIALNVRQGDLAFVRKTDVSLDRPSAAGENAAGFAVNFTDSGALVRFDVRFDNDALAKAALAELEIGASAYLAQDLYQGKLLSARRLGNELTFTVSTDLTGVVGLLLVVMPN